jgi:hypothetical protein
MDIEKLMTVTGAKLLTTQTDTSRAVECGYCCDLLSWVMAHGKSGMAWITVQTHMNVVAVATLMDMAAVIVPEGIAVADEVVSKAAEEGVALLSSEKTAYELCGLLYGAGVLES